MARRLARTGQGLPAPLPALIKASLDQLRDFERMEGGAFQMPTAMRPQASSRRLIRQEVLRQNSVEGSDRIPVEADLIRSAHKERDGVLVMRIIWASSLFPPSPLRRIQSGGGIEQRVSIASSRLEFQDRSMSRRWRIWLRIGSSRFGPRSSSCHFRQVWPVLGER